MDSVACHNLEVQLGILALHSTIVSMTVRAMLRVFKCIHTPSFGGQQHELGGVHWQNLYGDPDRVHYSADIRLFIGFDKFENRAVLYARYTPARAGILANPSRGSRSFTLRLL
jgi:hypothetical protein